MRSGPRNDPRKYRLADEGVEIGSETTSTRAILDLDGIETIVQILSFGGVSEDAAPALLAHFERCRELQWDSITVPRESWHELDTLTVVTNHTDGEVLSEWIRSRPSRDPIGSVAVLVPLAAALDALVHDHEGFPGHGEISTHNIIVRHDQVAVAAIPPLPAALADRFRTHMPSSGSTPAEPGPSAERDAFDLAGAVTEILTGRQPAATPAKLRSQLSAFEARPDLVERIVQARHVDPGHRPTLLVNWLARLRGATVTPDEMNEVGTAAIQQLPAWQRRIAQPSGLMAAFLVVALLAVLAFLVGRRTAQDAIAVGLTCDPAAQSSAAESAARQAGVAFTWVDTDGDCFHDSYEIHWTGTDYLVADESDSTYPSPAAQIRVLRNYYFDITQIRGLDPTSCDARLAEELVNAYIERAGIVATWSDRDNDCMHDLYETNAIGSDPDLADSDGDAALDGVDVENGSGGMLLPLDEQMLFVQSVHRRNHLNGDAVPTTDPVRCDPAAWQRAAVVYLQSSELPLEWIDPDGDCLHSTYEEVVTITDPTLADSDNDGLDDGNDPDVGDGMIEPIDRQFDVVGLAQ